MIPVIVTLIFHDIFNMKQNVFPNTETFIIFTACVASRPGQCGRADGYVLEGKELEFYLRKIKSKRAK